MSLPDTHSALAITDAAPSLRYREQDSTMTLAEGLEEYFRAMPDLLDPKALGSEAKDLFTQHDVAHIVFGCDTSLRQEAMMDTWTVFGTDVGFFAYMKYFKTPEAQALMKQIGVGRALWGALLAIPDIVRVIARGSAMKKKWPWRDHQRYMDRPLKEIREELGLVIVP